MQSHAPHKLGLDIYARSGPAARLRCPFLSRFAELCRHQSKCPANNACCTGLTGWRFDGLIPTPAVLTSNTGSVTLTWADGVLEDEISGALLNYHTFQPVCGVPTVRDISLLDPSTCFEDEDGKPVYTADVRIFFETSNRITANPLGNFVLSGDADFSAPASSFGEVSFLTIEDVKLPANGGPINLTATFDAASGSTFTDGDLGPAPEPCVIVEPEDLPALPRGLMIGLVVIVLGMGTVLIRRV